MVIKCIRMRDWCVVCYVATTCSHGDVRLVGGYTDYEGRVEVCINGYWGHVCYNGWDSTRTLIVCKQLFGDNISKMTLLLFFVSLVHFLIVALIYIPVAVPFNVFGNDFGKFMLYSISCTGSPSRLVDCRYNQGQGYYSGGGCYHYSEDAGARCYGMF